MLRTFSLYTEIKLLFQSGFFFYIYPSHYYILFCLMVFSRIRQISIHLVSKVEFHPLYALRVVKLLTLNSENSLEAKIWNHHFFELVC